MANPGAGQRRSSRWRSSRWGSAALAVAVAAGVAVTAAAPAAAAPAAADATYIVLYKENASSAGAARAVAGAGGTLVAHWPEIGVVVARSSDAGFAVEMERANGVQAAADTTRFATRTAPDQADGAGAVDVPVDGAGEPLAALQWDMRQIRAFEAHAVTGGSRSVVVGNVDTGLDFTHPDISPNYSAADSTDCSSGTPTPLRPGNDANGHGTHTAGTIAAAANGVGIAGVAPNVRIAGIKSSNDDGYFFPEMVICSYMWVAQRGIPVTNNSYFADPWLFNCRNDAEQRAIWTAERRAIRHAQSVAGTVVVASQGNDSTDLSHPEVDVISPDFPPGNEQEREISNACAVVPVEVPGVVGVTATGNERLKSFYSSYGVSTADVAAPGGDSLLQVTAEAPNGRVLSTYPAANPCSRRVVQGGGTYCYLQGTSMAGPHVAGVAALIVSRTGMRGGSVEAALQRATNPLPCPADAVYAGFPQNSGAPQHCQGGAGHNSFSGSGEIDALKAVG